MHRFDLAAILTIIVGIGALTTNAVFGDQLASVFGDHAKVIIGVIGLVSTVASVVLRVYSNPSPPSGTTPVLQPTPSAAAAAEKAP